MSGVEPVAESLDFPRIKISCILCFSLDDVKSSKAKDALTLFIPCSDACPVLKPYPERQRRSLLRDYLLTLAVNSRFSHGLVQMVQYGPI
jgi:hypothetical protein